MGGVRNVFEKIGIGGGAKKAYEAVTAPKSSQSTTEGTVATEDSGSADKRRTRQGKRKLQIPTSSTSGVATTGGTGLSTGA